MTEERNVVRNLHHKLDRAGQRIDHSSIDNIIVNLSSEEILILLWSLMAYSEKFNIDYEFEGGKL